MDAQQQLLFDTIRDVLENPATASVNEEALKVYSPQLAEGLAWLAKCVREESNLAEALARGDLDVPMPPPENNLAAPLKNLRSTLAHLAWQAQQVAAGDYGQRVDFMGDFSVAFNTMVERLEQRERALEAQVDLCEIKTEALEQSNSLLASLTNNVPQWIVVMEVGTGEVLFANKTAKEVLQGNDLLSSELWQWLVEEIARQDCTHQEEMELAFDALGERRDFRVRAYPLYWKDSNTVAYVFTDVSSERAQLRRLESYAYQDTLTGLNNRFYGMQVLRDWLDKQKFFSVCFVDLDNLKYVNDSFGHSEGDRYITQAAAILTNFSPDAVVSRLGGDEFMVLAEGFSEVKTIERMEQLSETMKRMNANEKKDYQWCMSYGVVEVRKAGRLPASEILAQADERMYQNKRSNKLDRKNKNRR